MTLSLFILAYEFIQKLNKIFYKENNMFYSYIFFQVIINQFQAGNLSQNSDHIHRETFGATFAMVDRIRKEDIRAEDE